MQLIDPSIEIATPVPPLSVRGAALVGQAMFDVLDRARVLEARGVRVRHLELGAPSEPPPPSVLRATAASLERGEIGYESPAGLPSLRRALAERIERETGRAVDVGQVVVSPANLLINQFLDLACDPGDRLVVFSPAFPTYLAAAAHMGLDVVQIPLDPGTDFELGAAHVERALACRPRAVIVNSANNPTGAVYDEAILHRLVEGCRRAGVWLLADETYADLAWGKPFASLAGLSSPGLVVMSSLSKVLGIPGFRTGWAVATPAVAERLARSTSTLLSCLPRFVQAGAEAGLRVVDVYAGISRIRYARTVARAVGALESVPGIACVPPASAFYLFVDVRGTGVDGATFAHRLLAEHATAVTPGAAFGDAFRGHIRLALCGPTEDVEAGVAAVADLARALAGVC
jgi:aspartate/methionine/tyrosine aminotransferase